MKTKKLLLSQVNGKQLTRTEMKNLVAGKALNGCNGGPNPPYAMKATCSSGTYTYSADSAGLATSWGGFWQADGCAVTCSGSYVA